MLGVPKERHEDFRRWSNAVITNLAFGREQPEARRVIEKAVAELNDYLTGEIDRHRREKPDDLLTVMVNIPDWTEAEIRSSAILLLLAGYDTTAKLMGACLVALEQHADQRRLVTESPSLIPNAIEEVLRWVGATHVIVRVVMRDTVLGGMKLAADDMIYLLLIAANRDPARWHDPHRFDIGREIKPNLGFGGGPHICLGAPLARVETKVALEVLLRLAPAYHLRGIDYGKAFFARGPEKGIIDVKAA
jgi:hypothetical protein